MIDQQQTRELYKKLPQKTRDIIVSPELAEIIDNITKNNSLNKNQYDLIGKNITEFLMGINNKEGVRTAISGSLEIENTLKQKIFSDIESEILNNLDNIYTKINQNISKEESELEEKTTETEEAQTLQAPIQQSKESQPQNNLGSVQRSDSGVGKDFEQIILNQARAMQLAIPPENLPTDEQQTVDSATSSQPSQNAMTKQVVEPKEEKKAIHNYIREGDPYREPLK